MMRQICLLAIGQSAQGTKGMPFGAERKLTTRCDHSHAQWTDDEGWVGHDPEEAHCDTIVIIHDMIEWAGIDRNQIAAVGISD